VRSQPILGWQDAPLAKALSEATGLSVLVDSQVRALALAEHWFGAATGVDNFIHLFVGNVIGAGFVFNGAPYRGARAAAGGLDHLPVAERSVAVCTCGSRRCFAMAAGDIEVAARARAAGLIGDDQEIYDLFAMAGSGNARARRLLRDRARVVGAATAALIDLLDPELVILGGGISSPVDDVETVREVAQAKLPTDRFGDATALIRPSAFGPYALGIAAGAIMLDSVYRSPEAFVPALTAHAV
jgi:predicted NBD/HSP70 family sugar kinase